MPRWSYRITDIRTGRIIHENVPFTDVRFSDSLDNGGKFTGTCPFGYVALPQQPRDFIPKLMIWPCRDGEPQGAYIVTGVQGDCAVPTIQVTGERFDWILFRRELYHTLNFTNVEQLDIARDLIRYASGKLPEFATGGSNSMGAEKQIPWLRAGSGVSNVTRTIVVNTSTTTDDGWSGTAGLFVGKLLQDLANRDASTGDNGFEMRADYGYTDGSYWAQLTFGAPMVGRSAVYPKKIVFEYPSKAVPTCQYGADGNDYANRMRVIGKERDGKRPTGVALNSTHLGFRYPLVDRNVTSGSATEGGNLNGRAAAQLAKNGRLTSAWNITLNASNDVQPAWGTYRVGDHVLLRVKWGGVLLPDQVQRITGWDISVDNSGASETITPTLMDP